MIGIHDRIKKIDFVYLVLNIWYYVFKNNLDQKKVTFDQSYHAMSDLQWAIVSDLKGAVHRCVKAKQDNRFDLKKCVLQPIVGVC